MDSVRFGRGSRGGIIRRLQVALASAGYYTGNVDGVYGGGTERAVSAFQHDNGLAPSGTVDATTWAKATALPVPTVAERCLQVTAAFEGHGYSIVQGNFDGALLTWGIIGFTLKAGRIQEIVLQAWQMDPHTVRSAFGERTAQLIDLLSRNKAAELSAWANSISLGRSKTQVAEPWRSAFMTLGESPLIQQLQIQRAMDAYYTPCLASAQRYNLASASGVALCFDIHVQNGSIKPAAHARLVKEIGADFTRQSEGVRREVLAHAVAEAASKTYAEDVRSRKLALASGSGRVHGEFFEIGNWGIGEFIATEPEAIPRAKRAKSRGSKRKKRIRIS